MPSARAGFCYVKELPFAVESELDAATRSGCEALPSMTYEAIAAWASVVAASAAVVAVIVESRRSRFTFGIDLLTKLDERFQSGMQAQRRNAAQGLLAGRPSDSDDVLDFFEVLGILVKRKALDPYFVWHFFFYWLNAYASAAAEYITTIRHDDPTIWQDLSYLRRRLRTIERRERRCGDSDFQLSKDEVHRFLLEESALAPSTS